jgi:phosphohistidine phosphatase SixA/8-oxo-dGTP pyrophosphatase MutT (NUDIX family)
VTSTAAVRAAGGVVLRAAADGRSEVLLVHRPSHRDWTLPKGKLETGEPDEAGALREVREETGFVCWPGPEIGATRYRDRHGRPKRVRYWAMTVRAGAFHPNDEVDAIRWVPVAESARELSYPGDRMVVGALSPALRPLVFLVRHGRAEAPAPGDDRGRPLDSRGRWQAARLAAAVAGYPVARLLASPADRCVQTLEPLAARLGASIERHPVLDEGARAPAVRAWLLRLGEGPLVCCTHGDVVAALVGGDGPVEPGAVWLLAREGERLRPVGRWGPVDAEAA